MKLAEDLKKAILKIAMQGKLTEQKETDTNIDDILSRISEGKQKVISQGLITKEKMVSEISEDEIPFDIPKSWRWIKVGDVLGIARGGSPRPINSYLTNSEDGYNWIKIGDTEIGGKYINHTAQKIKKEGLHKTRLVHKGDLLLSNSMSFGRPYILNIDGCIHDGWLVLHDYTEMLNKEFLYYLFSSPILKEQFSGKVSGAVVKNLNSDKVAETIIPIPPIEEQQRIVQKLNQILPLIDEYGKEEDELITLGQKFPEEMKKSVLQAAMQGKLTKQLESDSNVDELLKKIAEEKANLIEEGRIKKEKPLVKITEEEIPFDIPETWRFIKLGSIINLLSGRDHEPSGYNSKGLGVPYMTGASNISNGELIVNRWTEKPTAISHLGDLLITCKGTIGEMAYNKIGDIHIARQIMGINTYNGVSLDYIQICLKQKVFELNQKAKSMIPGIARDDLLNLIVPLPPIEEQQRIVEKINSILPVIDSMDVYETKKKAGRPKQEEALAFISSLLGTQKSTDSKPVTPEILELTSKAKEELPAVVKKYADLMGVTYNRITIRHQKTRWGSCTKTGNLSFNCLILKIPETVRDYVIVHELAHRKELNHSTKFWTIVAEYCPWYKEAKLWLKDNGQNLMELK